MKKLSYLIVLTLILGLVLTGCLLSNVGQVPTTEQSGITYLTKGFLSDLVGQWHFDEGAGIIAYDSSEDGTDGTITGATYAGSANAMFGDALRFNGTDDYVKVPDSTSLNVTDYTLELWINANDFTKMYPTLLNRRVQSPTVGYYWIWIKGNCIVLTYSDGIIARSEYWVTPFSIGEWYHIALAKSGSSFTMYKNGSSLGTRSLDYQDAVGGDMFIGTYQGKIASRYNFDGIIDEVRIWNTALTPDMIEERIYYGFNGLMAPYAPPGEKAFKAGRTIPLKWQYTHFDGNVDDSTYADPVVEYQFVSMENGGGELVFLPAADPGSSGLHYDTTAGIWQWQFNWQTKDLSTGIYKILITSVQTDQVNGPFLIELR